MFALICNPKSGKGKPLRLLPKLEAVLNKRSIPFRTFTDTLPDTLEAYSSLILMGGDGTLNYTLNYFRQINIPIGIVPCGTGNDVGYGLLGKLDPESYFDIAIHGLPKPFDVGMCNNRYFLNGVGIGFDGWVVRKLLAKSLFSGKAAYYSTVLGLLLFYRESKVSIILNDTKTNCGLFMFCAANGPSYGGGFKLAPIARFDDGLLDMLTVGKISLLKRMKYLPVIEHGKHLQNMPAMISYQQAKSAVLESSHLLQAHLDGEWFEAKRFEIKIIPGYVNIRRPESV